MFLCKTCNIVLDETKFSIRNDSNKYRTNCNKCRSKLEGTRYHSVLKTSCIYKCKVDEYIKTHKDIKKIKDKDYRIKNSDKVKYTSRMGHLRRKYGISLEVYSNMLNEQKNCCKICNLPETSKNPKTGEINTLAVDHCHITGIVRGLLCFRCNTNLGIFENNKDIFDKYLENYK